MATVLDDLWPEDIKTDDVLTPQEILEQQAQYLTKRTSNILVGQVVKTKAEDRTILRFEVFAPRIDTTLRLFSVQHRRDLEYPVVIEPPGDELPSFLKVGNDIFLRPGVAIAEATAGGTEIKGAIHSEEDRIKNAWIADSPTQFTEKIAKVLASSIVIARVLSLISRSTDAAAQNDNHVEE